MAAFELFRRLPSFSSRLINFIAGGTLMVYLLHDNAFVYSIWNSQDWINVLYYDPAAFIFYLMVWAMGTFAAGIVLHCIYLVLLRIYGRYGRKLIMKK